MLLCLREPLVRFLCCCCHLLICWCSSFCCCSSHCFSTSSLILQWTIAGVFTLHFIPSAQPTAEWFAALSFVQPLCSSCERYRFEWAYFTHRCFLPDTLSLHFWHNLLLPRPPRQLVVLPWNLQGFILILGTQTQPICLFDSQ